MNCFNHQDIPAIGSCKSCCKGLCRECAIDLDHGIACNDKHENEVEALNTIIERNIEWHAPDPENSISAPLFLSFMGIVFAGLGFYSDGGVKNMTFIIGVGFFLIGLWVFISRKKIFSG